MEVLSHDGTPVVAERLESQDFSVVRARRVRKLGHPICDRVCPRYAEC